MKYNTGGKVPGKSGAHLPGAGSVNSCDTYAASMGTSNSPNTTADTPPGGKGSTGTPSNSTPR